MTEKTYLIIDTRGEFWSGGRWVKEYPDAELYDFRREAIREADLISNRRAKGREIFVIENYGLETEVVVYKRKV